ncbi:hypothetical protein Cni_G15860 [Canna indica]|uniref:F-box domain-containing protein n=1 Tax=Canna indica TaxID=4628 RepID=A0AAQ3QFC3_9LILI|nr:hypothetical protein Cni_G15860 [Canna indica]
MRNLVVLKMTGSYNTTNGEGCEAPEAKTFTTTLVMKKAPPRTLLMSTLPKPKPTKDMTLEKMSGAPLLREAAGDADHPSTNMGKPEEEEEEEEDKGAAALHGDVLHAVIYRASFLDLLSASLVSKEWRTAVLSSSLHRSILRPPSLLLHLNTRRGAAAAALAFDPISRTWQSIPLPSAASTFRRLAADVPPQVSGSVPAPCGGTRFYSLSPSKLALAADPFGASWCELDAPHITRTDPVVAVVGRRVVVAGGTSEFEDDTNSVEVWDCLRGGGWDACEPMPEAFRWSRAISAAASERRLYVMEKQSPFTASWFDPEANRWGPSRRMRIPDPTVRVAAVGFVSGRLVVAGAGGRGTGFSWSVESVRMWAVNEETLEVEAAEEVGRMPREMVAGLVEEGGRGLLSMGFLSEGAFAYVYNQFYMKEFFLCEMEKDGCRWERVAPPPGLEERPMHRLVFGCCQVGTKDIKMVSK